MKLERWTPEQRQELAHHLARGLKLRDAANQVANQHEDLYLYGMTSLSEFQRSKEGKELIQLELSKIRKAAEERTYAHTGSRLDSLIEIAEDLFWRISQFSKDKTDVPKYVSLCDTFRQYMEAIRKEMEPYQEIESGVEGWLESIVKRAVKQGVPGVDESWVQQETQKN